MARAPREKLSHGRCLWPLSKWVLVCGCAPAPLRHGEMPCSRGCGLPPRAEGVKPHSVPCQMPARCCPQAAGLQPSQDANGLLRFPGGEELLRHHSMEEKTSSKSLRASPPALSLARQRGRAEVRPARRLCSAPGTAAGCRRLPLCPNPGPLPLHRGIFLTMRWVYFNPEGAPGVLSSPAAGQELFLPTASSELDGTGGG